MSLETWDSPTQAAMQRESVNSARSSSTMKLGPTHRTATKQRRRKQQEEEHGRRDTKRPHNVSRGKGSVA